MFVNMPPRKIKTTKKVVKKNEPSWQITTIPLHSWILFWVLVLATMALATLCFTSAFRPAQPEVDDEALAMFQAVRESLEQQVKELEGKAETAEQNKKILNEEKCLQYPPSSIDNYLVYVVSSSNISVRLPFSTGWLNEECVYPPAQTASDNVLFGPKVTRSEYAIVRDSNLSILPVRSVTDLNDEIEKLRTDSDVQVSPVERRVINGLTVFKFDTNAPLGYVTHYWYALGNTFSYKIESVEWLTDAEAVKIIQSLRVTQ
jgi:hypothetical protein